jgi:pimeloyl-ACP methyl ester carboxylesterase
MSDCPAISQLGLCHRIMQQSGSSSKDQRFANTGDFRKAPVILLVHGTFASVRGFPHSSCLRRELGESAVPLRIKAIPWSGRNSARQRLRTAKRIARFADTCLAKGRRVVLVGHSHGGTVATMAIRHIKSEQAQSGLRGLVTLGTPFLTYDESSELASGFMAGLLSLPLILVVAFACLGAMVWAAWRTIIGFAQLEQITGWPIGQLVTMGVALLLGLCGIFNPKIGGHSIPEFLLIRFTSLVTGIGGIPLYVWMQLAHRRAGELFPAVDASVHCPVLCVFDEADEAMWWLRLHCRLRARLWQFMFWSSIVCYVCAIGTLLVVAYSGIDNLSAVVKFSMGAVGMATIGSIVLGLICDGLLMNGRWSIGPTFPGAFFWCSISPSAVPLGMSNAMECKVILKERTATLRHCSYYDDQDVVAKTIEWIHNRLA